MSIESAKVVSLSRPVNHNVIEKATVTSNESNGVVLHLNGKTIQASVAFSCLVQPELDDIVLLAGNEEEGFYVLGILERPASDDMTIRFPGSTSMQCAGESLDISANNSLKLMGRKMTCVTEQAIHKSREAFIDFNKLTATGAKALVNYDSIRILSQLLNIMAKNAISKFQSYIRHTDESEQVRAGQLSHDVKGMYTMDAKYTIMVSKKDTKIDGERIHVG